MIGAVTVVVVVQVNKQKEEVILDHLHETAYQGTGLGRTILGPEVGRAGRQKGGGGTA